MNHAFPIAHVLYAPGQDGKLRIVNAVVTLSSEGPSVCLRPEGKGWVSDNATAMQLTLAASALGGIK